MLSMLTNESISAGVGEAKREAQEEIELLGMAESLQKNYCWEYPPISFLKGVDIKQEEDNDDLDDDNVEELDANFETAEKLEDPLAIEATIYQLEAAGIVEKDLKNHLVELNKLAFKRLSKCEAGSLPMYEMEMFSNVKKSATPRHKHCPYVEINHGGKMLYIYKTTAVWLLQEGEQVSSDRLFRVRNKQPFMEYKKEQSSICSSSPTVSKIIHIGDICAFRNTENWQIGRILQFSYYMEKTKRAQQFSGIL